MIGVLKAYVYVLSLDMTKAYNSIIIEILYFWPPDVVALVSDVTVSSEILQIMNSLSWCKLSGISSFTPNYM